MLIWRFRALNICIRKKKRSKINHWSFHFKKLGKEKQIKHEIEKDKWKVREEKNKIGKQQRNSIKSKVGFMIR